MERGSQLYQYYLVFPGIKWKLYKVLKQSAPPSIEAESTHISFGVRLLSSTQKPLSCRCLLLLLHKAFFFRGTCIIYKPTPSWRKAVTPHISSDPRPPLPVFQGGAMVTVSFSSPLSLSHSPPMGLPFPLPRKVCKAKSSILILPNPWHSDHLPTNLKNFYSSRPRVPFLGSSSQSSGRSPAYPSPI